MWQHVVGVIWQPPELLYNLAPLGFGVWISSSLVCLWRVCMSSLCLWELLLGPKHVVRCFVLIPKLPIVSELYVLWWIALSCLLPCAFWDRFQIHHNHVLYKQLWRIAWYILWLIFFFYLEEVMFLWCLWRLIFCYWTPSLVSSHGVLVKHFIQGQEFQHWTRSDIFIHLCGFVFCSNGIWWSCSRLGSAKRFLQFDASGNATQ